MARNDLCQHTHARKARSHGSQERVLRDSLVHVATVTVFLACSGERPVRVDAMTRDSAGVVVVQNRLPLWTDEQQWVLESEPVVDLGGSADDQPVFLGLRAVSVLNNGNLVAASGRLNAVTIFDSTGALVVELGGRGEGPGEFSRIRDVYHCANDTIVVDDFTRLSFFDGEGRFARTIRLSRSAELYRAEGVYSTCAEAVVQASAYLLPTYGEVGTVESSLTTINLADPDSRGAPIVFPSFRVWHRVAGGGGVPVRVAWAPRAHWVISGDRMYLGLSDRPEIRGPFPLVATWFRSFDGIRHLELFRGTIGRCTADCGSGGSLRFRHSGTYSHPFKIILSFLSHSPTSVRCSWTSSATSGYGSIPNGLPEGPTCSTSAAPCGRAEHPIQ